MHAKTKDRLHKLCDKYIDIFSKHPTDTDKTDLLQISFIPRNSIKPLDPKPYILPLLYQTWFRKELTDLEKVDIISSSTSNCA